MSWSRKFEACLRCQTTKRPHEARGYCRRCYENVRYHENAVAVKLARSHDRATMPDDRYAAKRAKEEAWKRKNKERYKAAKAAWHQRTYKARWPIGQPVAVLFAGAWCAGEVIGRPNKSMLRIRLVGGTVLDLGVRNKSVKMIDRLIVQARKTAPAEYAQMVSPAVAKYLYGAAQ